MSYITFDESIKMGRGNISYIEFVSDKQIDYFLRTGQEVEENHEMIKNCMEPGETAGHLKRIIYQIKLLKEDKPLAPFEVWYNNYDSYGDVYDGWHRIRAYQYMQYEKIPCNICYEA